MSEPSKCAFHRHSFFATSKPAEENASGLLGSYETAHGWVWYLKQVCKGCLSKSVYPKVEPQDSGTIIWLFCTWITFCGTVSVCPSKFKVWLLIIIINYIILTVTDSNRVRQPVRPSVTDQKIPLTSPVELRDSHFGLYSGHHKCACHRLRKGGTNESKSYKINTTW